ncbi:MAG: SAM-dependent methyltransferase [Acidimicrobiaceae bacterium]|nr:SAM-dependent methyltransferase [Acidimicrobiaceae bacterium]
MLPRMSDAHSSNDPHQHNPWLTGDRDRGAAYDRRFERLAESGHAVHGEADLVAGLGPRSVLDAGCGTGRVAVELARRGIEVVGVDLDPAMLARARERAPLLDWVEGDLAELSLGRTFDAVVLAGNVMVFLTEGSEARVLARLAAHLRPGGPLVCGFSLTADGLDLATYDDLAARADLELVERWGTWERAPFLPGASYAVSLHRRAKAPPGDQERGNA